MKKRVAAALVAVCIAAVLIPVASRAAITPNYFIATNNTLLPFRNDTMPYISSGEILIPDKTLEEFGIYPITSGDSTLVRLYRGVGKYVNFYISTGVTEDQHGNTLYWPAARRVGKDFYVPLRQICDFFDLKYEVVEVPRDIIDKEQMWVIRINSTSGTNVNNPTFLSLNKDALRKAYNNYYAPVTPPSPPTDGTTPTPPPPVELPPRYSNVTVYLSFYDISEESVGGILDMLDIQAGFGYQACFFVSGDDISENPGLVRKISGSGHTIGIMLAKGTYDEYLKVSALLFEATKLKTVIVSAQEPLLAGAPVGVVGSLRLWDSSESFVDDETQTIEEITEAIPKESGARRNLMFSCSENAASMLPGIISYLLETDYSVERITETVTPP